MKCTVKEKEGRNLEVPSGTHAEGRVKGLLHLPQDFLRRLAWIRLVRDRSADHQVVRPRCNRIAWGGPALLIVLPISIRPDSGSDDEQLRAEAPDGLGFLAGRDHSIGPSL